MIMLRTKQPLICLYYPCPWSSWIPLWQICLLLPVHQCHMSMLWDIWIPSIFLFIDLPSKSCGDHFRHCCPWSKLIRYRLLQCFPLTMDLMKVSLSLFVHHAWCWLLGPLFSAEGDLHFHYKRVFELPEDHCHHSPVISDGMRLRPRECCQLESPSGESTETPQAYILIYFLYLRCLELL